MLTLPLLLQAVAALFRLSVRASGYSYVTVSNLVSYLLPVTIAILVLMAAILLVGVSIEAAGLLAAYQAAALAENERFFDVCGGHPSDGIRAPKAESAVVSGAGGSLPGASFIFDLPDVMPCEGGQIYPSGASGGELGRLLLVGVIVGAVVISLPTIFICFGCMLEQRSFRGGFLRSRSCCAVIGYR